MRDPGCPRKLFFAKQPKTSRLHDTLSVPTRTSPLASRPGGYMPDLSKEKTCLKQDNVCSSNNKYVQGLSKLPPIGGDVFRSTGIPNPSTTYL